MPVHVTFGEPMWAEDGETAVQFSERMAKEVRGLVDYTMTYRAERS
jgi:1-acyl-sn-glycerol-3-phosphate acyltransferase